MCLRDGFALPREIAKPASRIRIRINSLIKKDFLALFRQVARLQFKCNREHSGGSTITITNSQAQETRPTDLNVRHETSGFRHRRKVPATRNLNGNGKLFLADTQAAPRSAESPWLACSFHEKSSSIASEMSARGIPQPRVSASRMPL